MNLINFMIYYDLFSVTLILKTEDFSGGSG